MSINRLYVINFNRPITSWTTNSSNLAAGINIKHA